MRLQSGEYRLYEETFRRLERDFTLVYHDPRGSGGSDMPASTEEIHVGTFVEDLEHLRTALELDSFALVGHSHGGCRIRLAVAHATFGSSRRFEVAGRARRLLRHAEELPCLTEPSMKASRTTCSPWTFVKRMPSLCFAPRCFYAERHHADHQQKTNEGRTGCVVRVADVDAGGEKGDTDRDEDDSQK